MTSCCQRVALIIFRKRAWLRRMVFSDLNDCWGTTPFHVQIIWHFHFKKRFHHQWWRTEAFEGYHWLSQRFEINHGIVLDINVQKLSWHLTDQLLLGCCLLSNGVRPYSASGHSNMIFWMKYPSWKLTNFTLPSLVVDVTVEFRSSLERAFFNTTQDQDIDRLLSSDRYKIPLLVGHWSGLLFNLCEKHKDHSTNDQQKKRWTI